MIAHSSACCCKDTLLVALSPSRLTHPSPPLPPVATTRSLSTNYRHRGCSTHRARGYGGVTAGARQQDTGHGGAMRGHAYVHTYKFVFVHTGTADEILSPTTYYASNRFCRVACGKEQQPRQHGLSSHTTRPPVSAKPNSSSYYYRVLRVASHLYEDALRTSIYNV